MIANNTLRVPRIESRIQVIRGLRVMLDVDLAALYEVQTKRLNEQVKRNRGRFPSDFFFQLTADEKTEVVANCDHLQNLKFFKALPSRLSSTAQFRQPMCWHQAKRLRWGFTLCGLLCSCAKRLLPMQILPSVWQSWRRKPNL